MPPLTNKVVSLLIRGKSYASFSAQLYVAWQWNLAGEEREGVDTSAGWDEND